MTVNYSADVATARGHVFIKLLGRWKASVYKLLWKDLLAFLVLFYTLHVTYWFVLDSEGRKIFEGLVFYCEKYKNYIPLSFVLGFFVTNIMTRWWAQYQTIPVPNGLAVQVSCTIQGYDEVGRAMRRTIMRYVCLSLTIVFRILSPRVGKRFPKISDLVEAGLLHENELEIFEDLENKHPGYSKNFMPIVWASSLVNRARRDGRILDDYAVQNLIQALNNFRGQCSVLASYNTVSIPLVYTQVVTIAVYTYFITALMAQQYIEPSISKSPNNLNFDFIPIMVVLQFIFYMGWLKVAETLMNPFGEDDDDFEINRMIDTNLRMSYLIVDDMHNEHPTLLKDQYWEGVVPKHLSDKLRVSDYSDELKDMIDFVIPKGSSSLLQAEAKHSLDVEQGRSEKPTRESSVDPGKVPKATVVSDKFKNNPDVREEQKSIQRTFKRISKEPKHEPDQDSPEDEKPKKK